jgi:hypothetical protein
MVKGRPQRPEWRQKRGENSIQQSVDLQKRAFTHVFNVRDERGCQLPQGVIEIEVLCF